MAIQRTQGTGLTPFGCPVALPDRTAGWGPRVMLCETSYARSSTFPPCPSRSPNPTSCSRSSTPPRSWALSSPPARPCAFAMSWPGPASARGCAFASCTPSITADCWRRSTRAAFAWSPRSGVAGATASATPPRGRTSPSPARSIESLQRAAEAEDIELIVLNNRYQPKVALKNAEQLVRERVDLVIEFQTDEAIAPAIASKYLEAGIPLVAIDIPHPGATYFGANNYQAGLLAGRHLGQWAKGAMERRGRRSAPHRADPRGLARPRAHERRARRASGRRCARASTTARWFRSTATASSRPPSRGYGGTCACRRHGGCWSGPRTTPSALGAARAFQEAGRAGTCAIVGQNAEPDARAELREPRSPLVASIGLLPRAVRGRPHPTRARHPLAQAGRAGRLHSTPAHHGGERRSLLPERRSSRACPIGIRSHLRYAGRDNRGPYTMRGLPRSARPVRPHKRGI